VCPVLVIPRSAFFRALDPVPVIGGEVGADEVVGLVLAFRWEGMRVWEHLALLL